MTTSAFVELFDRMPDLVRSAVEGLDEEQLATRLDPEANSIAWLVWHLTRVQDDHVAGAAEALGLPARQSYDDFADRFDLPFDSSAIGYGHSAADVAAVRAPADLLVDYHSAVHQQTMAFLAEVDRLDDPWGRAVDERWDPPVTLLVRIASVANEVAQHVGQAAFVRGVVERNAG